jgi:8-oxo-dGTP pyrophosphatase MutT (NUDIX family)
MDSENKTIPVHEMVLVFIQHEGQVALGLKARKIGEGKWNGFGGNVEGEESFEEAAHREVLEEAGALIYEVEDRGVVDFHRKGEINRVHMFVASDFGFPDGSLDFSPKQNEILKVAWFDESNLPWGEMMAGDRHWIPQVLAGEIVEGEVHYTPEWELVSHKIETREEVGEMENLVLR